MSMSIHGLSDFYGNIPRTAPSAAPNPPLPDIPPFLIPPIFPYPVPMNTTHKPPTPTEPKHRHINDAFGIVFAYFQKNDPFLALQLDITSETIQNVDEQTGGYAKVSGGRNPGAAGNKGGGNHRPQTTAPRPVILNQRIMLYHFTLGMRSPVQSEH